MWGGISRGRSLFSKDFLLGIQLPGAVIFFQHRSHHFSSSGLHSICQKVCCCSYFCASACHGLSITAFQQFECDRPRCTLFAGLCMCVCVIIFLLRTYRASWVCWFKVFINLEMFLPLFSQNLLSYSFWDSNYKFVILLCIMVQLLRLCFLSASHFSPCASCGLHFIAISLHSLICFRKTHGQTQFCRSGEQIGFEAKAWSVKWHLTRKGIGKAGLAACFCCCCGLDKVLLENIHAHFRVWCLWLPVSYHDRAEWPQWNQVACKS